MATPVKAPVTIKQKVEQSQYQSNDVHVIMGYAFIFAGILFWVIGWYSVVFSKVLMPFTGH